MKIDRALFLAATGALASGCVIQSTPAQNPPAPAPAPVAASPTPAPTPGRTVGARAGIAALSKSSTTPPTTACLDNEAAAIGDCAAMQAPAASCSGFAFPQTKCNAYKAYFKPKVAAQAVTCLQGLSSQAVCDATQTYTCGTNALRAACPDANLAQLCQTASSACHETAENCVNYLSGLNDAGRQKVAACVAQGCTAGLYSCIEGL
jgi:hypothetical protein